MSKENLPKGSQPEKEQRQYLVFDEGDQAWRLVPEMRVKQLEAQGGEKKLDTISEILENTPKEDWKDLRWASPLERDVFKKALKLEKEKIEKELAKVNQTLEGIEQAEPAE